jgi:DNA processing protein
MRVAYLTPDGPGYPALLGEVASPPALFVRGELGRADALAIAIVGARRATPYGIEVAERLAGDLAARGVTIVSGLARGIDTAAHRGAVAAGGRTVAVLGSGVDVIYPPENRQLAVDIERAGALVSQFPPGTPPLRHHFPIRNRTLAGLALGVVVVEAAQRSGALITAGFAADLGREVFAVPGRVTTPTAAGPNALIRDGATLTGCWSDIVQELPAEWRRAIRDDARRAGEAGVPLSDSAEARVLAFLSDEPQQIDRLMAGLDLPPARVAAALVALEVGGRARQLEGQRWIAISTREGRA